MGRMLEVLGRSEGRAAILQCFGPGAALTMPRVEHSTPAGFPSPAADFETQRVDLVEQLGLNEPSTFLARVRGLSMIGNVAAVGLSKPRNGRFAGLANFATYFAAPSFSASVGSTLAFAALTTLLTVPLAFLFALFVLGTALLGHPFWNMVDPERSANMTQFLKNLAIMGGLLLLAVSGPGRFSVDGR